MQEELKKYFDYHEDGYLINKISRGPAKAGIRSGCQNAKYVIVRFKGKLYKEHRLIWIWHKGNTDFEIDHIDENKKNNKIENLQELTHAQNIQKSIKYRKPRKDLPAKKGFNWDNRRQKYRVRINISGKSKHIGYFKCMLDARAAYMREYNRTNTSI